jgi:hypothetical protein
MTEHKEVERLTLEMDGPRITADKFRRGVNAFLDVLDEVVKDISGAKKHVQWIIGVRSGSLLIDLQPESTGPEFPSHRISFVLDAIQNGCDEIERGEKRPPHFSDLALSKMSDLASILHSKREGLDCIRLRRNGRTNQITVKTLANVDSILGAASKAWGSVDGWLSVVSDRGSLNISIYDDVSERYVKCLVPESLLDCILASYRKRISVSGLIRYHRSGIMKDILVEEFEVFPDPRTLPDLQDLFGIFGGPE